MDTLGEGMIPKLILWHHLGLGDHIICNGLVHEVLKIAHEIILPCKPNNLNTIGHLYLDYPNVNILDIGDTNYVQETSFLFGISLSNNIPLLRIGFNGENNLPFDKQFYEQLGLDFGTRWTSFRMPKDDSNARTFYSSFIKHKEYALVHNTSSVGNYKLEISTTLPIYYIDKSLDSMLDWKTVIENATEIHCIDSSFIHLVDSLKLNANKLVYHDVGRGSVFHLSNQWEVKTYNQNGTN